MMSKHVEYKSMVESKMSFETYFNELPNGIELDEKPSSLLQTPKSCMCSFLEDKNRTFEGIINNLIKMLEKRVATNTMDAVEEENVNGYVHMSLYEKYEEYESVSFSTIGNIKTDNGSLDINLNFSMSRNFIVENRIDTYAAFDPLVINLEGNIPNLLESTFSFDLDNDGESDQISKLGSASGFLALDKNLDGKINQGSELFGTLTGNGFEELAAYDEDGNDWIDENDSIFDSLQIWLKNEDKNEKELLALGEVGIGAIYLHSQASEFSYKTAKNQTLGEMKSSGIFLFEDSKVGNVSQIDLSIQKNNRKNLQTQEQMSKVPTDEHLASLLQV